jgi:2'-5' RNA ligase
MSRDTPVQKYCIVSLLENTPVGTEFHFKDWPLHLTLAGVFALPSITNLQITLSEATRFIQPFELIADEPALWGEDGHIHVMKFKMTQEILDLHATLLKTLRSKGAVFNEEIYIGDGYTPHVTDQKHAAIQKGETIKITSISFIDMFVSGDWQQRKILWTLPLVAI